MLAPPLYFFFFSNAWKFKQGVVLSLLTLYITVLVPALFLIPFFFLFLVLTLVHVLILVLVLVLFAEVCSSAPGSDPDPGLKKSSGETNEKEPKVS